MKRKYAANYYLRAGETLLNGFCKMTCRHQQIINDAKDFKEFYLYDRCYNGVDSFQVTAATV